MHTMWKKLMLALVAAALAIAFARLSSGTTATGIDCAVLTRAARALQPECQKEKNPQPPPPLYPNRNGLPVQNPPSSQQFTVGRVKQYVDNTGFIPIANDNVYQQIGQACVPNAAAADFSNRCGQGLKCVNNVCKQGYGSKGQSCSTWTSPPVPCKRGLTCVQRGGVSIKGECKKNDGQFVPRPPVDPADIPEPPIIVRDNMHW